MKTVVHTQVPAGDMLDDLWKLYQHAFAGLAGLAVQRHVMYWDEFKELMLSGTVDKYVVTDDTGQHVGLGVQTSDLGAIPLISPEYFARHYPDLYDAGRIWYVAFIAVHPDARGAGVFAELVCRMSEVAELAGGVTGLDYCRYNQTVRDLPRVTQTMLRRRHDRVIPTECVDEQSYWVYDFRR